MREISPNNTEFIILSFEGPDLYSLAGGLGVRVTNLSEAFADQGFNVHLFFVGDPKLPGEEYIHADRLILHRWCQWISEYHPAGVYQGEYEKHRDFSDSVTGYVVNRIVKPAVAQDKVVVIMGEEWQTAEAMCRINELLHIEGIREKAILLWNINNTFGFHHINWTRLANAATITTVSRYMKQIMLVRGLRSFVIPNGIPGSLLEDVDESLVLRLRRGLDADLVLSEVARWDPDKQWLTAVEAVAQLKATGLKTVLLARGGIEPHGWEVLQKAFNLGLTINEVGASDFNLDDYLSMIEENNGADIISIRSHCTQGFLRIVYRASNAVLSNSGHEPFGLVGLETMAAGGIAFTGSTGEDYVIPFHNAIVLETSDPIEIEGYVMYLEERPYLKEKIRIAANITASMFTWEEVIKNLIQKLEYRARTQGLITMPSRKPVLELDAPVLQRALREHMQWSREEASVAAHGVAV
ncbi:MAG: glycosyltransferase family 4 protein [Dehalococcoidia bacterium]|nr:MAG: glycosyltransferase family 4 protein [Dehalococcoidia bacterium]